MQASQNEYIFSYPWETVIKGFFNKYPTPELSFVKFNNVYDIEMISDNCIQFKRIMFLNFYKYIWAYSVEEIKINIDQRLLEMKSQVIKKSSLFPQNLNGVEKIKYSAMKDSDKTLYNKFIDEDSGSNFVKAYLAKINSSFLKGCQIVEQKCKEFMQSTNIDSKNTSDQENDESKQ